MIDWCPQELSPLLETLGTVQWNVHSVDGVSWLDKAIIPLASTLLGAVAGSGTILYIEKLREQRQILADINASICVLATLSNALIILKKDFLIPTQTAHSSTLETYERAIKGEAEMVGFKAATITEPRLVWDLPTERLFAYVSFNPDIVPILHQTKRSLLEVEDLHKTWNIIAASLLPLNAVERTDKIVGRKSSQGVVDNTLRDTLNNLAGSVNASLFYINRGAIPGLRKLGKNVLPKRLRKKLLSSKIDAEHENLIPPKDHVKGWCNE